METTTLPSNRTIQNTMGDYQVTFLETSAETQGAYTLVEVDMAPKGGNGLHFHKTYSETFEVITGELGVQIDQEEKRLSPGQIFTVPAFAVHRFFNPSTGTNVRFRVKLSPGQPGFENTIKVGYGLGRDGQIRNNGIPKNFYHLCLLFTWSETFAPGLLSFLEPVLRWGARRAVKIGVADQLLRQYC